ncbi:carbohydrate ABC transporter permease [Agromyces italicus]|uniref:carbohydrate ABC transporter permease n=1 Tax=Agromyces italicus TaxID=279572 RepID=UPI0004283BCE|nr:carbohydrate ABC transporter permease [Agromyces italicus]
MSISPGMQLAEEPRSIAAETRAATTIGSGGRPGRRAGRRRGLVGRIGLNVWALVIIVCSIFPVYWMVNMSFTPSNQIISRNPSLLPLDFTFKNYITAWTREAAPGQTDFPHALISSITVGLAVVVVCAILAFLASIALARFAFRGRVFFIVAVLVVQMVPGEAMMFTIYNMIDDWRLMNTLLGLFIVHLAAVVPFTIWTLRGFVKGVPAELEEAAMIDGCTKAQAFWKVTFPLMAPALVSTGIFAFIQSWNEFLMALLLLKGYNLTLPPWLNSFQSATEATNWGAVMAGSTLIALPVVIFFLFVQGRMVGGLVNGAVKG